MWYAIVLYLYLLLHLGYVDHHAGECGGATVCEEILKRFAK